MADQAEMFRQRHALGRFRCPIEVKIESLRRERARRMKSITAATTEQRVETQQPATTEQAAATEQAPTETQQPATTEQEEMSSTSPPRGAFLHQ